MDSSTITLWTGPCLIEGVSGCFFIITTFYRHFLCVLQTVLTLIRRHNLQRLILVYTVCHRPFYESSGVNGFLKENVDFMDITVSCIM